MKHLLICLLTLLVFFSCEKEDNIVPHYNKPEIGPIENLIQIGNYYKVTLKDTLPRYENGGNFVIAFDTILNRDTIMAVFHIGAMTSVGPVVLNKPPDNSGNGIFVETLINGKYKMYTKGYYESSFTPIIKWEDYKTQKFEYIFNCELEDNKTLTFEASFNAKYVEKNLPDKYKIYHIYN